MIKEYIILTVLFLTILLLLYVQHRVNENYKKEHRNYINSLTETDKIFLSYVKDFQKSIRNFTKLRRK